MLIKELQRKDLNSLLTLMVLLEEQSVSKAAERLFLTQSAISKALGRLRESFADPLFVRVGQKLVPTPLAMELKAPLDHVLNQIHELYKPVEFDPSTFVGEFKIGIVEGLDMTFIPFLIERLAKVAPKIVLNTFSQLVDQIEMLQKGELDFIIAPEFGLLEEDFESVSFFQDRAVVIAREGHPLRSTPFTSIEACMKYQRVVLHTPDFQRFAVVRDELYRLRDYWHIGFETDNLITAISTVARTDFLLPSPSLVMMFASENIQVRPLAIENSVQPVLDYHIVNTKRVATSAAHLWVKQFVLESGVEFSKQLKAVARQFNARLKM